MVRDADLPVVAPRLIEVPELQNVAVALDGTIVLAAKNGLFAVHPGALPAG